MPCFGAVAGKPSTQIKAAHVGAETAGIGLRSAGGGGNAEQLAAAIALMRGLPGTHLRRGPFGDLRPCVPGGNQAGGGVGKGASGPAGGVAVMS